MLTAKPVYNVHSLPLEHSAILSTFIKLPFVIKIFVYFEWPFYTGFTVYAHVHNSRRAPTIIFNLYTTPQK